MFKFEREWLDYFKDWLTPLLDNPNYAHCEICNCNLSIIYSGRHALLVHEKSKKHQKNRLQRMKEKQKSHRTADPCNESELSEKSRAHLPISTALRRSNSDDARVGPRCFTYETVGDCIGKSSRRERLDTTPTTKNLSGDPKECPGVTKEIGISLSKSRSLSLEENISKSYGSSIDDESHLELPHPRKVFNIRDFAETHSKTSQETADHCLASISSEKVGHNDIDQYSFSDYLSPSNLDGYSPLSLDESDASCYTSFRAHLQSLDTCFLASTTSVEKAAKISSLFKSGNTETLNEEQCPGTPNDINNICVDRINECSSEKIYKTILVPLEPLGLSRHSESRDINTTLPQTEIPSVSDPRSVGKSYVIIENQVPPFVNRPSTDIDQDEVPCCSKLRDRTLNKKPHLDSNASGSEEASSDHQLVEERAISTREQTSTFYRNLSEEMDQDIQIEYPQFTQFPESLRSGVSYAEKKADVKIQSCSNIDSITRNDDEKSSSETKSQPGKVSGSSHLSRPLKIFGNNVSYKQSFEREIENFLERLTSAEQAYVKQCRGIMEEYEEFLSRVISELSVKNFRYNTFDSIFLPKYASSWSSLKLLGLLLDKKNSGGAFSGETQLRKLINVSSPERKYFSCHKQDQSEFSRAMHGPVQSTVNDAHNEDNTFKEYFQQRESERERKRVINGIETRNVKKRRFSS